MAITILVDSLPYRARPAMGALVDCMVIVTAGVIGGASIPLQVLNAGETTTMLGIGYVWMTAPMTLGCALFMVHAAGSLLRRPRVLALAAIALVAALVLAIVIGREGLSAIVTTQHKETEIIGTGRTVAVTSPDQVLVSGMLQNGAVPIGARLPDCADALAGHRLLDLVQ